jgi:uncharacterized cupin superfamily protein
MTRPDFIKHWTELERSKPGTYPGSTEQMALDTPLSNALGITRIGIHHTRLLPGHRSSYPHAESSEEEFVFVLEGKPDVWIDGHLHALVEGDAVAFAAGTGICHTFINNTKEDVRLMTIGERPKPENRRHYPLNEAYERAVSDPWIDWPERPLGPHDAMPN